MGDERRVSEDGNQDVVVVSTRHRAAICSGRLDMIIESESGRPVQPKQSATVPSHFKVNQLGGTSPLLGERCSGVQVYRGRREEYIYIERVLGRCAGMCGKVTGNLRFLKRFYRRRS